MWILSKPETRRYGQPHRSCHEPSTPENTAWFNTTVLLKGLKTTSLIFIECELFVATNLYQTSSSVPPQPVPVNIGVDGVAPIVLPEILLAGKQSWFEFTGMFSAFSHASFIGGEVIQSVKLAD